MTTLWKTVASDSGQSELIPVNSKFKEVTKPNAASPNKGINNTTIIPVKLMSAV